MVYELKPDRCALLIIDAQREYFDHYGALHTPHAREILASLSRLLGVARASAIQVIFIRHVHAADGSDAGRMGDFDDRAAFIEGTKGVEIVRELAPGTNEPIVDKTRFSALVNTRLESILKTSGVDTLIVTGLMTQYCSVTTARHGNDLDYRMTFVVDANAEPDMPDAGLRRCVSRRRPARHRDLTGRRYRRRDRHRGCRQGTHEPGHRSRSD
jgi:nicotinamidase-related amidase